MVGPSLTDEEQRVASLRLKLGFVLIIGFSAGVIALQAQGSLVQTAGATAGGLLLGWLLVVYLSRIIPLNGR